MKKFELAEALYKEGYDHDAVRKVWVYAFNEQRGPKLVRKRPPWEKKALDSIGVRAEDIEFDERDDFRSQSNYF